MSRCTFVWAHGLQSSMAHEDELGLFDWAPVRDVARVVRYDARGHGQADPQYEDRAYRWSTLVDDMLWAAGTVGGPFVAGGACMGAATALYTALRAPRRIQALVVATPPAAWDCRDGQVEAYASAAKLVERRGMPSLLDSWRTRPQPRIFAQDLPLAQDIALRHLAAMDEKALPAILRGMAASDLPCQDEMRALVVPTLILAWDGDPCHPVDTAKTLADTIIMSEIDIAVDLAGVRRWPTLVRDFVGDLCLWD
ncbi:MAG: alpha/beta fold hydrolase [Acidimicrobiales bacterium]